MENFVTQRARPEVFTLKPYMPGKPIEEVKRELGLEDIIKMASNENPLGPSPLAKEAVWKALDNLNIYPDANCFVLKTKLAEKFGCQADQIVIGNGSDELLMLLANTFVGKGEEVIFVQPSFAEYEFTSKVMGGKVVPIDLKEDFSYNFEAVLAAVTPKTKIVYICNPNNPTGNIATEAELDDFIEKLPDYVLVVFDEAYYEYAENPLYTSGTKYLSSGQRVIVLRTFSKIYGLAALRVGYGITHPAIAAAIERVTEPFNVNMLAQIAAAAALDDQAHLEKSKQVNAEGKAYLYREFAAMGLHYIPTESNFIFVDVQKDCQQVFKALLQKGVIIRSGDIFGYPAYIRVTIGTASDNERFIAALKQVLKDI